jgi:hypothetical protein
VQRTGPLFVRSKFLDRERRSIGPLLRAVPQPFS